MKVRINADLGTDIHARMEAGWSVDKILEDLGSPKEVADRFNAELGAERKPGGFRYIFLVLGAAAAVYAVYILAMNLYMKSMVQRQFRESVSLIGGADGPTSIFVSYTVGMIGNWMMSGGFVLACLDMYRFLGSSCEDPYQFYHHDSQLHGPCHSAALHGGICAGGAAERKKEASGDKEGALSGEITIWSWDVALAHLEEWAEKFQEENPDVSFNFEEMGVDQVYQKMTTCLQSGIGLPDIVSIEGEQMAKFGEKFPGKFEEFTDMINPDDFFPIKLSECTVDGKVIAYPWDSGPCGMFYRSDLFEQAGIKAEDIVTWDDFIEAGKVLKDKTGADMLCMAESRNDTTYRLLMMEGGGFYFDKDGNTQVNSEASIQAMETCKKMYDAGITFNNSSWDDMVAGMGADKFACIADAVWMVGSIKDAVPDQDGKWAVMPLPKFQADSESQGASNGGSVLAVPSASKSAEAAKAFVKYVMEDVDANVEGFQNYGLYPSYLKALESDVFKEGDEFFGGQKIFDLFTEIGKTVPQVNYTANFAEALEMSKNSMAKVMLNNGDPTEVLNAEQEEMKAKFGK